jgi:hypothetical protein
MHFDGDALGLERRRLDRPTLGFVIGSSPDGASGVAEHEFDAGMGKGPL